MATSAATFRTNIASIEVVDTDCTTASSNDLTGSVGSLGPIMYEIDNTGNTTTFAHLKVYDSADPADGGSASPELILRVQAGVKRQFICMTENTTPAGDEIANLSLRCVTEGGIAGTTSPAADVTVRVLIRDLS